jgi:hypothetical protein
MGSRPIIRLAAVLAGAWLSSFAPTRDARAQDAGTRGGAELEQVYQQDFTKGELSGWDFTDASAWRVSALDDGKNKVLEQHRASKYEPKVRSPFNIALVKDVDVSDFVMNVRVRSTTRDYGHRDLCFFFSYQDPSHFYYVHLGKEADEHANSIFIVNDKPRETIAESRTSGTPWTDGWHRVRLVRNVSTGLIQVFFDDMERPVMTAHDRTFGHGRIGVGSFDDTGMFDDLDVRGKKVPEKKPSK